MHFEEEYTYHIYNRSNDTLFYTRDNYIFFLDKLRKLILPYSDMLAWRLLPNHFNFLLVVKPEDWEFSSYRDYLGMRKDTLVNTQLAEQIVEFDKENFAEWSKAVLDEKMLKAIW